MLLLLYAQPLVRVVTLKVDVVDDKPESMSITLGQRPTDVPEPFATLLLHTSRGARTSAPALAPTALG